MFQTDEGEYYVDFYFNSDSDDADDNLSESESETDVSFNTLSNSDYEESATKDTNSAAAGKWTNTCEDQKKFIFCAEPGLKQDELGIESPYEFFCLFANNDFYELLVQETNLRANELVQNCKSSKSRINNWKELSVPELKVFLGLLLHMGHIRLPHLGDYWKTDWLFDLRCFSQHMSRNRFLLIKKCLHFCGNAEAASANKVNLIKPLLDHFNSRMDAIYYPGRELLIDESMVLWKGHLVSQQFIKNKKQKYGIKLYQLTEPTGLVLRTLVHCGALDDTCKSDHTENVVHHLMMGKLGVGHALYMERSYTSHYLASLLLEDQTHCTGILKQNRHNNPREVIEAKLKKEERKCQFNNNVQVTKWCDVLFISNEHEDEMTEGTNCKNRIVRKPLVVANYDKFMNGVDRKKQAMAYYPLEGKTVRWYLKIGIHLIQSMTLNSFHLFQKYSTTKMTYYDFRLFIVRKLLSFSPSFSVHKAPKRQLEEEMHIPSKLKTNAQGKTKRKRCRTCLEKGKRKDTVYCCEKCPTKPALCLGHCFKKYHDK